MFEDVDVFWCYWKGYVCDVVQFVGNVVFYVVVLVLWCLCGVQVEVGGDVEILVIGFVGDVCIVWVGVRCDEDEFFVCCYVLCVGFDGECFFCSCQVGQIKYGGVLCVC